MITKRVPFSYFEKLFRTIQEAYNDGASGHSYAKYTIEELSDYIQNGNQIEVEWGGKIMLINSFESLNQLAEPFGYREKMHFVPRDEEFEVGKLKELNARVTEMKVKQIFTSYISRPDELFDRKDLSIELCATTGADRYIRIRDIEFSSFPHEERIIVSDVRFRFGNEDEINYLKTKERLDVTRKLVLAMELNGFTRKSQLHLFAGRKLSLGWGNR
jgi:hypothetical protein